MTPANVSCSVHVMLRMMLTSSTSRKMMFVVLRCLSRNAWEYIMALTLTGVRHLISPRWLEKM